jgi:adenine-specific DNA-methyltransferase
MQNLKTRQPQQSLSAEIIRFRPDESEFDRFKTALNRLLGNIDEADREKNQENHIRDFLLNTFYKDKNAVNGKGDIDLVIHEGKSEKEKTSVIIETKRPSSGEMISAANPNNKALRQAILYFMQERVDEKNNDLKHIVVTNIKEWFVFDAVDFNKHFYDNAAFRKEYEQWRDGKKVNRSTVLFYDEIAKPFLDELAAPLEATYFNLKDYETASEKDLIALYKIFSPYHLLKKPTEQDSNRLDQKFYTELLHIIGLEETREKNKTLIKRKAKPDSGSLLEKAIAKIESKYSRFDQKKMLDFGATREERVYNIALELCIVWTNRILFLKLLESQLIAYHEDKNAYSFLNAETINNFGELYVLFHDVLNKTTANRDEIVRAKYAHIPYLNSSLFDFADVENLTIMIDELDNNLNLTLPNSSILKKIGETASDLPTLEYLFRFLDAYDFASEGKEDVQKANRSLINASVLGKVFEKINGYKDGSIYTPGFITMYMCRQAIRLAVVQRFKNEYDLDIETFNDLYIYVSRFNKAEKITEFNLLINDLKLCDPAVGSGHFLVSALNEILAIKSELGIFADTSGKPFSQYKIKVANDELLVTDRENRPFRYMVRDGKPLTDEMQNLQRALFHEKQLLIENCLFGVDINPNSVKICRLRLWIELLKNAYYKQAPHSPAETRASARVLSGTVNTLADARVSASYAELETLPNIDINIKQGNSLLSRFTLGADLKQALKTKNEIKDYRDKVNQYKNERNRDAKRELIEIIERIKGDFRTEIFKSHPKMRDLAKKERRLYEINSPQLFDKYTEGEREVLSRNLETEIALLNKEIEAIKTNAIYKNAFEWRFEFPEVLDNDGNFLGFDIVIGNPPYIGANELAEKYPEFREHLSSEKKFKTLHQKWDIYIPFIELSTEIVKNGLCSLIIPFPYINQTYSKPSREFVIKENTLIEIVDLSSTKVFKEVTVNNCIIFFSREKRLDYSVKISKFKDDEISETHQLQSNLVLNKTSIIELNTRQKFNFKNMEVKSLGEYCFISKGMVLNADEIIAKGLFVKSDLISETESKVFSKKYVEAKNIDCYEVNKIRFLEWNTLRVPKLISRPTFQELYENNKLLINKIGKLKATFDDDNLFCDQTIRVMVLWKDLSNVHNKSIENSIKRYSYLSREKLEISSSQIELKFILAIVNSRLGNYLLDSIRGKGNIDINPEYLRNLPIKQISPEAQAPFVELVDEILRLKKAGEDTTELENRIDEMVYDLYELDEAEREIVKGAA